MALRGKMKNALKTSLAKEEEVTHQRVKSITSKFDKADQAMGVAEPEPAPTIVEPEPAQPEPVEEVEAIEEEVAVEEKKPKPKAKKAKKVENVIRDTFSMPKPDFELINKVMDRNPALRMRINKSEILRAGVLALSKMNDTQLKELFGELDRRKAGRPAQD